MTDEEKAKPITKQELDVMGVSFAMIARVGAKTFSSAVSPMDYHIFKSEIYRDKLHSDLIKRIEYDLEQEQKI